MRVIDGMHRLRAARLRGQETVDIRFYDGSADDVLVVAVQANCEHGLPLTLADRRAAVERLIRRQSHRSDRALARIAGLSARTVAQIRRQLADDESSDGVRLGRDGRLRPLDSTAGRRVAVEVIARRPQSSLREVARLAGVSLGTARDVRERVRRGEDPLPERLRGTKPPAAITSPVRSAIPAESGATDPQSVLRNLSRDPALRFTDSGRGLLQWLFTHARGPVGWEKVVDAIPPHAAYVVEALARDCARAWLAVADHLRHRLRSSA